LGDSGGLSSLNQRRCNPARAFYAILQGLELLQRESHLGGSCQQHSFHERQISLERLAPISVTVSRRRNWNFREIEGRIR
jgi:hypothetical protein